MQKENRALDVAEVVDNDPKLAVTKTWTSHLIPEMSTKIAILMMILAN